MDFLVFCLILIAFIGVALYFGLVQTADEDREPWEPGYRGKG